MCDEKNMMYAGGVDSENEEWGTEEQVQYEHPGDLCQQ